MSQAGPAARADASADMHTDAAAGVQGAPAVEPSGPKRWRIVPSGDACLVVEFAVLPEPSTSRWIAALVTRIRDARLPGVYDVVPAMTTIGVHYRSTVLRGSAVARGRAAPASRCSALVQQIDGLLAADAEVGDVPGEIIDLPVCYGGRHGPDLAEAAARCGLSPLELVALHTAEPVTVLALGFAPGLPYLGNFDPRLALPRRPAPRSAIAPGTIGLANRQSVIYPLMAPGGWNLIGRTPLVMFDPARATPCLLEAGDRVRFRSIEVDEFEALSGRMAASGERPRGRVQVQVQAPRSAAATNRARSRAAAGGGAAPPAAMVIEVLRPGAQSTFQDLGRRGLQHSGIPVNGAMDQRAHRIANWAVGNPAHEATLEITLIGPTLKFGARTVIALCGADLSATIDGMPMPIDRASVVAAGSVLSFGRRVSGVRAYLAVRGGFSIEPVMGSASTYLRGGYGGLGGRALRAGDRIGLRLAGDARVPGRAIPGFPAAVLRRPDAPIRVVAGRHWDAFDRAAQHHFFTRDYTIRTDSDRMGYRLDGPLLSVREPLEIVSEVVGFGTVQVPSDGRPIVLMADCQTTGGYPKIAEVAGVDLPRMAQRMPGESVRFESISLAQAHRLLDAQEQVYAAMREVVDGQDDRPEL